MTNKQSGYVWLISGLVLLIYGGLYRAGMDLPGVGELIDYINSIQGGYLYAAAFVAVFIEGLYIIGSFFPGSSLAVLFSILSQGGGYGRFALTIVAIFWGWVLAGAVNIWLAARYRSRILKREHNPEFVVKGKALRSWYPHFRSNYEVTQVIEGGKALDVFLSSVKVKFFVSLAMAIFLLVLPQFIDINNLGDNEGLATLIIIAAISIAVGVYKIRHF